MLQRVLVRSFVSALAVLATVLTSVVLLPGVASADSAPADPSDPTTPPTVAGDSLPTVQIDGVAWSQKVIGNTVYVAGNFTTARPAGAAPGVNTTPRANLLAYDLTTGALITNWAPTTNGEVNTITASPDNSRIYIGGNFTTVNGTTRNRIAALNPVSATPASGGLVASFRPNLNARVRAITATQDTVYFGGLLTTVGGVTRARAAAVSAADGALLNWAPNAAGGSVFSMALSPDQSQVLIGGSFTTMNGSSNPGYGLASVDPVLGTTNLPWAANTKVRNGGANAAITALTVDGGSVYVSGYVFGAGGNLEGTVKVSWNGGTIEWVEDCHGDTYGTYVSTTAVYTVSHSHYCGNLPGGFGQSNPWTIGSAFAFSKAATGTLRNEYLGYANWAGNPSPSLLAWYPRIDKGTFTGQGQAAWTMTGNADYLAVGGEFPSAGGTAQQGLTRYATRAIAPNKVGPELTMSKQNPTLTSPGAGQVLVSWQANWDRDNENLTYRVIRDGDIAHPIYTKTVGSRYWNRPYMSFLDTNVVPGASVRYRIFVTDPLGNEVRSDTVTTTASNTGSADAYARAVAADGPMDYWRLGDTGSTNADYVGRDNGTATSGVTRGAAGVTAADPASTFDGSAANATSSSNNGVAKPGPFWYTVEGWFQTTTTRGGKIVGYGNARTGSSTGTSFDRQLYMTNSGAVMFGSRQGSVNQTLTSAGGLNDGQWHYAVGTVGDEGMNLYIDGVRVGTRSDVRVGASYDGYWRIGGDNLSGWANRPTSDYFAGNIDEVAVYTNSLSANQVRDHFVASGRTVAGPPQPTDAYGQAVYDAGPKLFWRYGETSGVTAADSSLNGDTGTHINGPVLGGGSAIGVADDKSVAYDGVNDVTSEAGAAGAAPSVYSEELWFKTTTTRGGKLIGFGNARSGSSSNFDRQVFMTDAGKLRFGTYTGVENVAESAKSYNDGTWHHLVATQGPSGMQLYVDGESVGTNPQVGAQAYTGYWRVGGDNLTGWTSRPTSDYFSGSIDEPAVYSRVLSATEVANHFTQGGGVPANKPPVAAFTSSVNKLDVAFTNGSTDPDGTIASSSWDFGDGDQSTATSPSHTYALPGTYQVTLTVTDDSGDTNQVTKDVTTVANVKPTAAFTSTVTDLSAAFDSTGSGDSDGTIVSRSWDFGDGATSTATSPTHAYGAAGTFPVTLTVTDDNGATDTLTQSVTTTEPPANQLVAEDSFGRTVSSGWGSAGTGGAWTPIAGAAALFNVANGVGTVNLNKAGVQPRIALGSVASTSSDTTVKFALDKIANGGGAIVALDGRSDGSNGYRTKIKVDATGRVTIYLMRTANNVESNLMSLLLPSSLRYAVGDQLQIRMQVQGTSPTTLRARVWKVGTTEPTTWQVTASDSTAGIQSASGISLMSYLWSTATNAPVTVSIDDLQSNTLGP